MEFWKLPPKWNLDAHGKQVGRRVIRFGGRKPDGIKGGVGEEKQNRVRTQEVPGEETPAHSIAQFTNVPNTLSLLMFIFNGLFC
jgi:hypothetical protein